MDKNLLGLGAETAAGPDGGKAWFVPKSGKHAVDFLKLKLACQAIRAELLARMGQRQEILDLVFRGYRQATPSPGYAGTHDTQEVTGRN